MPTTEPHPHPAGKPGLWVPAAEVQPGDWTLFSQYRPVAAVKVRPRRREVVITRPHGDRDVVKMDTKDAQPRLVRVIRP